MTFSTASKRGILHRSFRAYYLQCLTVLVLAVMQVAEAAYDDPDYDEDKREKPSISELYQKMKNSKLWFLRDMHPSVPFSPLTALLVGLLTLQVYLNYGTYAWCQGALEIKCDAVFRWTTQDKLRWTFFLLLLTGAFFCLTYNVPIP